MLVIIFTYNRPEKLARLVKEIEGHDYLIIDDGTDNNPNDFTPKNYLKTPHEGKQGFWKKWIIARQLALGSEHKYFLLLPDDVSSLDLKTIKAITQQGWDDALFAVNVINDGRTDCWGIFKTGQESFNVNGSELFEVGFVDCGFLTNRETLLHCPIEQVQSSWFDRADKSSGVGYQMTQTLRRLQTRMLMASPTLADHGAHFSVMHHEHRDEVPLIAGGLEIPAYVINLKSRPKKWEQSREECRKIETTPERFNAFKRPQGWEGCRVSHLTLMKKAKKDDVFMILEDDFVFCVPNPKEMIRQAMDELPDDWDILYLGATLNEPLERYSKNLCILKNGWTTHAMIFNNEGGVVDYILEHDGGGRKIDVFYNEVIQEEFNCFVSAPMIANQRDGFSDILNRDVDNGKIIRDRFKQYTE